MSLSKLTQALASNNFEISPSLISGKLDFSLFKVEVPTEFCGIEAVMSRKRRDAAENGRPHITARKLGCLFELVLPPTPTLFQAYGRRASEIAKDSSTNLTRSRGYGMFSEQAGTDVTSLWAAATSGSGAIAVHLLACMLARIWDRSEATSIWVEIVEKRKEQIQSNYNQSNAGEVVTLMTTLAAAQQEISRTQLAEWDASARAWLQAADKVKREEVGRLRSLMDIVRLPVNNEKNTYDSVVSAWTNSLLQLETLLKGTSLAAQSGDLLLAGYSWHLFPDISVAYPKMDILQHDKNFPANVTVTIGLENRSLAKLTTNESAPGVYWSLPLSRLRYYGAPVKSQGSLNSNKGSRLSIQEFMLVFFGGFIAGWGKAGLDTLNAANFLSNLEALLVGAAAIGHIEAQALVHTVSTSWLGIIFNEANYLLKAVGENRTLAKSLVALGRRQGPTFLGLPKNTLINALHQGKYVNLIKKNEDKIGFLRQIGEEINKSLGCGHLIIRIRREDIDPSITFYEYATAIPWNGSVETSNDGHKKRKLDHNINTSGHRRWLCAGGETYQELRRLDEVFYRYSKADHHNKDDDWAAFIDEMDEIFGEKYHARIYRHYNSTRTSCLLKGEEVFERRALGISNLVDDLLPCDFPGHCTKKQQAPCYTLLYGDTQSAAIFILQDRSATLNEDWIAKLDLQGFSSLAESGKIEANRLADFIHHMLMIEDSYLDSLHAVSTAISTYKAMPEASIDVRVLQQRIADASWYKSLWKFDPAEIVENSGADNTLLFHLGVDKPYEQRGILDDENFPQFATKDIIPKSLSPCKTKLPETFSCITLFDSGRFDIPPEKLNNVMAMSSGDSIYVSSFLLNDPWKVYSEGEVTIIAGNIGRPGIAYLIPPKDPMIKEVTISEWPYISHQEFDGKVQNYFENTSLHISFTEAFAPVNVGSEFNQDTEVYELEAVVSLHDGNSWIADLDINKSLKSRSFQRLSVCQKDHNHDCAQNDRWICIDDWHELLQPPEETISLVRAHKNWEARLAAAALSIALGYNTVILPENMCWQCFRDITRTANNSKKFVAIS